MSRWAPARIGDEGPLRLLGHDREAGVVLGQIDLLEEPVGGLDGGDPGHRQLLGQAILEGAEGALGSAARFGRVGGDVLDAELRERAADLGRLIPGDLRAGLGRVEVVARPVGVERARQAVLGDHLAERLEAAHRPFLVDQKR